MEIREIPQDLDGAGLNVGIAVASFNSFVTDPLKRGALDRLEELGVASVDVVHVAGGA